MLSAMRVHATRLSLSAAAAVGVAWFFWFKRSAGVQASTVSDRYQEVMVLVKGSYTPDAIRVAAGQPLSGCCSAARRPRPAPSRSW